MNHHLKNYLMIATLVLTHPLAFATGKLPEVIKRERFTFADADREAILLAIANLETENGRNMNHVTGEKTIYGITRTVWEQHTAVPWSRAGQRPELDKKVSSLHLEWIIKNIAKDGMRQRVEYIFAAWHMGLSRAYMGDSDYAIRGGNLYY